MDDYAIDFIRKNSLNEISKNKANKELLNLKKKQFGITDIKIPKNNFVFEQNKK